MTLSGYCFGALTGAIISYFASLSGAVVVFLLSRAYCSEYIGIMFDRCPSLKRVIRAIEKRPNILFLIRLAPYPYNVMNVLLAAAPTLTLRTYTTCTALSLLKVIVHTSIGASIHSFSHHSTPGEGEQESNNNDFMSRVWTGVGVALCVGVLIYIMTVARRAVDGELDEECTEETVAFLQDQDDDVAVGGHRQEMSETSAHDGRPLSRMETDDYPTDFVASTRK